jgi:hypothetical protein
MWSANRRGAELSSQVLPYWRDLLVVVVGGIVYVAFLYGHALLAHWAHSGVRITRY